MVIAKKTLKAMTKNELYEEEIVISNLILEHLVSGGTLENEDCRESIKYRELVRKELDKRPLKPHSATDGLYLESYPCST